MNQVGQRNKTAAACFEKAMAKGEPIFVLRAQDFSAPFCIDQWIEMNEDHLGTDHPKIVEARTIRDAMLEWPNKKQAD